MLTHGLKASTQRIKLELLLVGREADQPHEAHASNLHIPHLNL